MATVSEILAGKGMHLITVSSQASVYHAAIMMNEQKIGSLLVLEEGRLVGILTERDIMARVVADRLDADATRVIDVMTRDVVCCRPHTDVEEARCVMKNRRVRHLPVLSEEDTVVGMISIGDLNAFQVDCHERTIHLLEHYIHSTW
jgi:CBS domain-containing protein